MITTHASLPDVVLFEPDRYEDDRGFLVEAWVQARFDAAIGHPTVFVQDNYSQSKLGVLRGLHYQAAPFMQGKLVRVAAGAVWDVAVDLRPNSDTFAQWCGVELSAENHIQMWIPPGFAHGFYTLTDDAVVTYKMTAAYQPDASRSLRWDDPSVNIQWPIDAIAPVLSATDKVAPLLDAIDTQELLGNV